MSTTNNNKPTDMRTLYIGLGGTGGHVLFELYKLLSTEEKNASNSIYLDLDKKDTTKLEALGVKTIRISSADTVLDMAEALGPNDGVYKWLPNSDADSRFLASGTDDGASQYRYKSRLCLANFLNNPSNELKMQLQELCRPGITISKDTLRVMIVSSVAGGTGSGTFIEIALYVRKFFRDIGHPEIRIMGLFACPELFAQTLTREGGDEDKRIAMYANAYAAIRELNAMNLAVSGEIGAGNGYGKFINMSIDTRSEGYLFNSKDPDFSRNYNTKPFDLLYFVDLANRDGGILGDLTHYYKTMADVAYARLYCEIESVIRGNESNELGARAKNPTAIYGSAGYSRIIYPYEDILRYLAEAKTFEELDTKWFLMETKWNNYKTKQQKIAGASGRYWTATPREREQAFITNMDKELNSPSSVFQSILPAIGLKSNDTDRVNAYFNALQDAVHCASYLDTNDLTDGKYSLGLQQEVADARTALATSFRIALTSEEGYLQRLENLYSDIHGAMLVLSSRFAEFIPGAAVMLASAILPTDTVSANNALAENDPVNLYNALLRQDGKDVHPIAARYLLYRVRQQIRKELENRDKSFDETQAQIIRNLELCLDQNPDDGADTVEDIVNDINRTFWGKAKLAEASLSDFVEAVPKHIDALITAASDELLAQAYTHVVEALDILIGQYEGLYDNMDQYRNQMRMRAEQDLRLYEDEDERDIYICASPDMLQHYYYQQPSVSTALSSGNAEIYSAAGKSIYEALTKRTWKILQRQDAEIMSQGSWKPQDSDDHYEDLGHIFDNIVTTYTKFLRERATYLQTSVIDALYRQACHEHNLDSDNGYKSDATLLSKIHGSVKYYFDDLVAKAMPLLRYTKDNRDDRTLNLRDVSIFYKHLGLSPAAEADLKQIYQVSSNELPRIALKNALGFPSEPSVSALYSDHEIFCFSAVHCLQPNQIFMFREDTDNSYYSYYQRRLATAAETHSLAETPHIDKRWHVRGAIPYISPKLEMEWNEKTMKALLYLMLQRQICFDYDANNTPRFYIKLNGKSEYIQWPHGTYVGKNSISRLLEYLADQEGMIEELSQKLDVIVNYQVSTLSNYIGNQAVYKGQMTRNELLRRLRADLLVYEPRDSEATATHGKNSKKANSNLANEDEPAAARALYAAVSHEASESEPVMDQDKTMGGLLEFACLLHKSEERLGEDRDFGEAMLKCASGILDKFCRGMYGENLTPKDTDYKHYINLYNSAATRFLQEYVVATARKRKLTPDQMVSENKNQESLGPAITEGSTLDLDVPTIIRSTNEYDWIEKNWEIKGNIVKR